MMEEGKKDTVQFCLVDYVCSWGHSRGEKPKEEGRSRRRLLGKAVLPFGESLMMSITPAGYTGQGWPGQGCPFMVTVMRSAERLGREIRQQLVSGEGVEPLVGFKRRL